MASEAQVKLSRSANIGGQTIGGVDELVTADYQQVYRQLVPTGNTDWEVDIPITVSNIYVSAVHSNQNVTLLTNEPSTSTPTQTIAVTKNVAQIYSTNEPATAKTFTANVTKVFITNSSGFDALVQIGVAGKQSPTGGS